MQLISLETFFKFSPESEKLKFYLRPNIYYQHWILGKVIMFRIKEEIVLMFVVFVLKSVLCQKQKGKVLGVLLL